MKIKDQIFSIIIFILSITGYLTARNFPTGPDIFPKSICIGMIALSFFLMLFPTMGLSKGKSEDEKKYYFQVFLVVMISLMYYFLIEWVGYFIITPIYLAVVSYALKYRKIEIIILYPIIVTAFLFLAFRVFLKVPLPMGLLELI